MAMSCVRLFTVPPLPPFPDFNVPRFSRCIALLTLLPAALPYLRPPDLRRALADTFPLRRVRMRAGTELRVAQQGEKRFSRIVQRWVRNSCRFEMGRKWKNADRDST